MAGVVVLAVLALVIVIIAAGIMNLSSTPGPVPGDSPPGLALNTTSATRVAAVTVTDQNSSPGCRWGESTSTGSIDFASGAISLTTTASRGTYKVCAEVVGDQTRRFGSVLYQKILPPYCHPTPCSINPAIAPPAGRPWAKISMPSYVGNSAVVQLLTTPYALLALKAFPRSATERNTTLHGETTHEYSATLTLARLETVIDETTGEAHHALASFGSLPGALPPPNSIPITLRAWIDSAGRVVRLSMMQPGYTVNFKSGASEGGYELVPSQYSSGEVPSDYPYKTGYTEITISFSRFGRVRGPIKPNPNATFQAPT
jgi:hypothetical protein